MLMCKIKLLKRKSYKEYFNLTLNVFFLRLIFEFEHGWGENVRRSVLFRLDSIVYGLAYLIRDQIGKKSILLFFFYWFNIFHPYILRQNVIKLFFFFSTEFFYYYRNFFWYGSANVIKD